MKQIIYFLLMLLSVGMVSALSDICNPTYGGYPKCSDDLILVQEPSYFTCNSPSKKISLIETTDGCVYDENCWNGYDNATLYLYSGMTTSDINPIYLEGTIADYSLNILCLTSGFYTPYVVLRNETDACEINLAIDMLNETCQKQKLTIKFGSNSITLPDNKFTITYSNNEMTATAKNKLSIKWIIRKLKELI